MKFTSQHLLDFKSQGYCILHDALGEEGRVKISRELRKCLPCWEEAKKNPEHGCSERHSFPYPSQILNRFFVDSGLIGFAKDALDTERIHYKPGWSIVRYPGGTTGSEQGWHIDNGNNSLLPESDDMRYGQVVVWYWPEDVKDIRAPMKIIPKPYGNDLSHSITLDLPGDTLLVMHNYLWHSGSDFSDSEGQRYSHAGMYGHADFYWEGLESLTYLGRNKTFREFIGSLSLNEREIFCFPPKGHSYYTDKTLSLLEDQYPGWKKEDYLPT